MARKITLSLLDQSAAKTVGWSLRYAADQLGVWRDKTEGELHRHFVHWLDRTKYDLSVVFEFPWKTYRIFKKGYTITEQIATAVAAVAGEGNDDVEIDYRHVLKRVNFVKEGALEQDVHRTFFHNMNTGLLPLNSDHNYWTAFLTADNEGTATYPPVVPSSLAKVFKARFDADAEI